jgi:serine O-acetyltransferase
VITVVSKSRERLGRRWRHLVGKPQDGPLWEAVRATHPPFLHAVVADARATARLRGDRWQFTSRLDAVLQAIRLAIVSDAFLAQVCYRAKASCQVHRIPVIPRIFHRLAMMTGQVCIGDPVVVRPGVYFAHGQVVIDGLVEIGEGVVLFPWVTIGLRAGTPVGPTLGPNCHIGTGAKVIGPVRVGAGAKVGANAVVLEDVPDHTTVVGIPAKPTRTPAPVM